LDSEIFSIRNFGRKRKFARKKCELVLEQKQTETIWGAEQDSAEGYAIKTHHDVLFSTIGCRRSAIIPECWPCYAKYLTRYLKDDRQLLYITQLLVKSRALVDWNTTACLFSKRSTEAKR
jgi:hypothetical protein